MVATCCYTVYWHVLGWQPKYLNFNIVFSWLCQSVKRTLTEDSSWPKTWSQGEIHHKTADSWGRSHYINDWADGQNMWTWILLYQSASCWLIRMFVVQWQAWSFVFHCALVFSECKLSLFVFWLMLLASFAKRLKTYPFNSCRLQCISSSSSV